MKDTKDLDECLYQSIQYLIQNWYNNDTGIVACALKDGDKISFATSSKTGKSWFHAERNAYNKFKLLHGEPGAQSTFIITLSPCLNNLKHRDGDSCVSLIKSLGITRIHFGVLDTMHAKSLSFYNDLGFISSITEDLRLANICNNLMGLFSKYESRINSELLKIKFELGDLFFKDYSDTETSCDKHSSL